ncbi:hypothetical protein O9K51_03098 [Purpureocillium lavendulum]|uniref:Homeobox domain-containing protein n=1 Tax=Purpureocillium lavendulum TaxID=1247861 RepID=A0AB34FZ80_9HYPO|nr:hypothetical protein O9K51_03098 [Purpureocillium lavendulum]
MPRAAATRPTSAAASGSQDALEYVHSPSFKRRRISIDDEQSTLRAKQVPRLYRSPERPLARQLASPRQEPLGSAAPGPWARSPRTDSYGKSSLPPRVDVNSVPESRSSLPSLPPPVKMERDHTAPMHRLRDPLPGVMDRAPMYQTQEYPYSYQHPSRYHSVSSSPVRAYDRAPFSARAAYGPQYQDVARYGNLGGMGMGADAKQRKRRGNLPKETTDKLRAWFVAHLQHPYPTEDEKQDLMRQTGLQMTETDFSSVTDQISNWFINARRRQLPAMINSARVESDAMNGRVGGGGGPSTEGKVLVSTEHNSDYGGHSRRGAAALPLSDGESPAYDDDMSDGLRKRRAGDPGRESV